MVCIYIIMYFMLNKAFLNPSLCNDPKNALADTDLQTGWLYFDWQSYDIWSVKFQTNEAIMHYNS